MWAWHPSRTTFLITREALQACGSRDHGSRRRELPRGLVGVGAYLRDPAAAQLSSGQGGPRLDTWVAGPSCVAVLPAVDRIGASFCLSRIPQLHGQDRRPHPDHRLFFGSAPVIEPPEP